MRAHEFISEKWSAKYKRSINCSNPKGFSQRAHCQGRKKHHESVEEEYQGGLRKWFKQKWVNIGRKEGGKHPECGTSGSKKGYAKCVPAAKAASMSAKEKQSAVRRKRQAQSKAGKPGKDVGGGDRKPVRVSTMTKEEQLDELTFKGSQCTVDCSGHRAGYEWSIKNGGRIPNSWSPSFDKGAALQRAGK